MLSGFKVENLFKVVQETLSYEYKQKMKELPSKLDCPLSQDEREFYQATLSRNMDQLIQEVDQFVKEIMKNKTSIGKSEVKAAVDATKTKPFADSLTDNQKKTLKKKIKEHMNKCFEKMNRETLDKDEVTFSLTRFFLGLLRCQDEYDMLLLVKSLSSVMQCEVKTYPQSGQVDPKKLKEAVENAAHQLQKGKQLCNQVIAPLSNISPSWSMVGLICLPNIPTRAHLSSLQLGPEVEKFILTAEELQTGVWLDDLNLDTLPASDVDYDQLGSVFVGSAFVSYQSQEVNHQKEAEQGVARDLKKLGMPNADPKYFSYLESKVEFSDLSKKALSSIPTIIYWNSEQEHTLTNPQNYLVFISDFGCGKTYMLMAAARKAAENKNLKVYYLIASPWYKMLKLSTEKCFTDSDVSVMDIFSNPETEPLQALKMFMDENGDKQNTVIVLDEVAMNLSDKKAVKQKMDSSSLTTMMNMMQAGSKRVWMALRSADLLDESTENQKDTKITTEELKFFLEDKTEFKMTSLARRVRNTALVAASVPANVTEQYSDHGGASDYAAAVVEPASSHTVPGEKPLAVLTDMGHYARRVIIGIYGT